MDRKDFYKKQKVTQAEVDSAFVDVEQGIWNVKKDDLIYGVIAGLVPTLGTAPTVDVTSGIAYDQLGRRVRAYSDGAGTKNHSYATTTSGSDTSVTSGNERWISIFAKFGRKRTDSRVDGDSITVYFDQDEYLNADNTDAKLDKFYIVGGTMAATGTATRPSLESDSILVCDILRTPSDTSNTLSTSRRQVFGIPDTAAPGTGNGLGAIMSAMTTWLGGRTNAAQSTLHAAIDKIITDLAATTSSDDGAERIGAASGTNLTAGSVRSQLDELDSEKAGLALANIFTVLQTINMQSAGDNPSLSIANNPSANTYHTVMKVPLSSAGGMYFRIIVASNAAQTTASDSEPIWGAGGAILFTVNAYWAGSNWSRDTVDNSNSFFIAIPQTGSTFNKTEGLVLGHRTYQFDADSTWDNTFGLATGWTRVMRLGFHGGYTGSTSPTFVGTGVLRLDTGVWRIPTTSNTDTITTAHRRKYWLGSFINTIGNGGMGGRENLVPTYIATPTQGTLTQVVTTNAGSVTIDALTTEYIAWSHTTTTGAGGSSSFATLELL